MPERKGDVKHSKASIDKIEKLLNYTPEIRFKEGLEIVYKWYKSNYEVGFETKIKTHSIN